MSDNPFQSPAESRPLTGLRTASSDSLKKVAKYQRGVLVCILAQVLVIALQFGLGAVLTMAQIRDVDTERSANMLLSMALLTASAIGAIYVFRLAVNVYHPAVGVGLAILALNPCIG